ncbi:hypothetical protein VP01_2324g3 [Puccinia sorghi]|uniref:Uncharacterized protein n=1 Tax=Puccinia sorghi TaxID=27349 RepID=A0A0L6V7I4_9BASI|nr:hypothetical protein VP01_2324g3 [Puccinia sorghi]
MLLVGCATGGLMTTCQRGRFFVSYSFISLRFPEVCFSKLKSIGEEELLLSVERVESGSWIRRFNKVIGGVVSMMMKGILKRGMNWCGCHAMLQNQDLSRSGCEDNQTCYFADKKGRKALFKLYLSKASKPDWLAREDKLCFQFADGGPIRVMLIIGCGNGCDEEGRKTASGKPPYILGGGSRLGAKYSRNLARLLFLGEVFFFLDVTKGIYGENPTIHKCRRNRASKKGWLISLRKLGAYRNKCSFVPRRTSGKVGESQEKGYDSLEMNFVLGLLFDEWMRRISKIKLPWNILNLGNQTKQGNEACLCRKLWGAEGLNFPWMCCVVLAWPGLRLHLLWLGTFQGDPSMYLLPVMLPHFWKFIGGLPDCSTALGGHICKLNTPQCLAIVVWDNLFEHLSTLNNNLNIHLFVIFPYGKVKKKNRLSNITNPQSENKSMYSTAPPGQGFVVKSWQPLCIFISIRRGTKKYIKFLTPSYKLCLDPHLILYVFWWVPRNWVISLHFPSIQICRLTGTCIALLKSEKNKEEKRQSKMR